MDNRLGLTFVFHSCFIPSEIVLRLIIGSGDHWGQIRRILSEGIRKLYAAPNRSTRDR